MLFIAAFDRKQATRAVPEAARPAISYSATYKTRVPAPGLVNRLNGVYLGVTQTAGDKEQTGLPCPHCVAHNKHIQFEYYKLQANHSVPTPKCGPRPNVGIPSL